MSHSVNVCPASMRTLGEIFHPWPSSRAQFFPVPSVAIPPRPFSPVKFSGLIERDLALLSRESESRSVKRDIGRSPKTRNGFAADCAHASRATHALQSLQQPNARPWKVILQDASHSSTYHSTRR